MLLNAFPSLFTYATLAPFVLRLALGFILLNLGRLKLTSEKEAWRKALAAVHLEPAEYLAKGLAFVELIGGLFILAGAYTQVWAIVFSVLFFLEMTLEFREASFERRNLTFYILVFSISLSLIVLGAGAFAFDGAL